MVRRIAGLAVSFVQEIPFKTNKLAAHFSATRFAA